MLIVALAVSSLFNIHTNYSFGEHLGSGISGDVYRVTKEGKDFAVKIFRDRGDYYLEKANLQTLQRYNSKDAAIISSIENYDDSSLALVMTPLCQPRGQLRASMNDVRQLLNFVKECARFGLVHYDLRPNNIMVDMETRKLCIIDWTYCFEEGSELGFFFGGTLRYAAPEVLEFVESREINFFASLAASPKHALHSIVRYIYGLYDIYSQQELGALVCERESSGNIVSSYFRKIEQFWARSFSPPGWKRILECVNKMDYDGIIAQFQYFLQDC